MKKLLLLSFISLFIYTSCDDNHDPSYEGPKHVKKYSGDLAVAWAKLQMTISRTTPGFNPGLATRAFAYSGLSLYEAVVGGMPGYKSVASSMIGVTVQPSNTSFIFFPASGNAAMASIIKSLIPTASVAAKAKIDSLETVFNNQFIGEAPADVLEKSVEYGRKIATVIFDWSKTDGSAEAAAKNSSYPIPEGFGLWKRTPPAFVFPVNVYANEIRTFVKNSITLTLPPAPIPYSEQPGSPFYNQVNEVYTISQSLTKHDSITVKTWGEFPGNFTNALRYQQIAIQLVDDANLTLDLAALAFAKHGMATNDAVSCVFNAKYKHNVVRPITYIREVLGYTTWNALNTTPPHPEYPAAHACVGRASSRVLESIFGTNYSFTDRTHESLYGARTYNSLKAYSDEAGLSRTLGGIHYKGSVAAGEKQGEKVGDLINQLPFKNFGH
ncbi:MAG TPA: vanadium-dependent haloperoxidase [Chryseolinea sp.]|jgi:hypothetical protein|nr:vanadium-dependent haloperoxidase [Chryseolinea sp.]